MTVVGPSPWLFIIVGIVIATIITVLFLVRRKGTD